MPTKAELLNFLLEDPHNTWELLIDFTEIQKGGVPVEEILARLRAYN